MSSYRKGKSYENYIKQKLKQAGAKLVVRSASSKTGADLVAVIPSSVKEKLYSTRPLNGEIWLVQVKGGKQPISLEEFKDEYKDLLNLEGTYRLRVLFSVKTRKGWRFF